MGEIAELISSTPVVEVTSRNRSTSSNEPLALVASARARLESSFSIREQTEMAELIDEGMYAVWDVLVLLVQASGWGGGPSAFSERSNVLLQLRELSKYYSVAKDELEVEEVLDDDVDLSQLSGEELAELQAAGW